MPEDREPGFGVDGGAMPNANQPRDTGCGGYMCCCRAAAVRPTVPARLDDRGRGCAGRLGAFGDEPDQAGAGFDVDAEPGQDTGGGRAEDPKPVSAATVLPA
jgi:hypothetical protein